MTTSVPAESMMPGAVLTTPAQASPPTTHLRNGLGIAALCCGLVGVLVGLIPIMFLASGALGILGITFGAVGFRRVRRGEANNKIMALVGGIAGVIALALAIWGIVIVTTAVNTLNNDLNNATSSSTSSGQHLVYSQEHTLIHEGAFIGNI